MAADLATWLASMRALVAQATPGEWIVCRYDHGGGRIHTDEPRQLVADLYAEGDRELVATFDPATVARILDVIEAGARRNAVHQLWCGLPEFPPCNCGKDAYDRALADLLGEG